MIDNKIKSQATRIFIEAAKYIRKYGWQKEGMNVHGQPRCSMGALASAYNTKRWDNNLSNLMYRALYDELNGTTLTGYNFKYNSGEKVAQLYERVASNLSNMSSLSSSS
jgi:hypothetical protein